MTGPPTALLAVRDRLGAPLLGGLAARRALVGARDRGAAGARPFARDALVRMLARDCASVLDIGTGTMRSVARLPCPVKLGLDPHRPYLEHRVDTDAVPLNADADQLSDLFVPGAVDLVTMMDVIEHLEAAHAREVLRAAENVAKRRVVAFTPRGWFPQEGYDATGLGGEDLQRHRSAWDVADFRELGYAVVVLRGYHDRRNLAFVESFGRYARAVDALVAWKDVSHRIKS